MKKSLFQSDGRFYKANLHTHTTISDGKLTPEEVKAAYKAKGYEVLAFTDHEIMVPHMDLQDEDFLPLTAIECEFREEFRPFRDPVTGEELIPPKYYSRRKVFHLIYLAPRPDETYYPWPTRSYVWGNAKAFIQDYYIGEKPRSYTFENVNAAIKDAKDHGFLVEYCHPFWSQNRYDDYSRLENVDFVETFNTACVTMGYLLDNSDRPYEDFLHLGKHVCPTCSDDSHNINHVGVAATYIKAKSLTYDEIFRSLKAGDVFASAGPVFHDIFFDPETKVLSVDCSPVRQIGLTTGVRFAKAAGKPTEGTVTHAEFDLSEFIEATKTFGLPDRVYLRLTLVDESGRKAYSKGYFVSELLEL